MKKAFILLLVVSILTLSAAPALAVNFDVTPFESSDLFEVDIDEFDDTGSVTLSEVGLEFVNGAATDGVGILMGTIAMQFSDSIPPVLALGLIYAGYDPINTDKVIVKTEDARYTFEVEHDTQNYGDMICEICSLWITDQNHMMIDEILKNNGSFKCRFSGDRDVDFDATVDAESLQAFYDAYLSSGALDNDFSIISSTHPCTIK